MIPPATMLNVPIYSVTYMNTHMPRILLEVHGFGLKLKLGFMAQVSSYDIIQKTKTRVI